MGFNSVFKGLMHKFLFYNKFIIYLYCSPLSTCASDGHLQSVMIPDAVEYSFYLLMIST